MCGIAQLDVLRKGENFFEQSRGDNSTTQRCNIWSNLFEKMFRRLPMTSILQDWFQYHYQNTTIFIILAVDDDDGDVLI